MLLAVSLFRISTFQKPPLTNASPILSSFNSKFGGIVYLASIRFGEMKA